MESGSKEDGQPADGGNKRVKAGAKRKAAPLKDPREPKRPAPSFVIYCAERMRDVKVEHTGMALAELTKIIALEWKNLPTEKKQLYSAAAEADKERYSKEYAAYLEETKEKQSKRSKVEREKQPVEQVEAPTREGRRNRGATPTPIHARHVYVPSTDIPVFTDQFLQYNREVESELRKLRAINGQLTEENSLLEGHVKTLQALAGRFPSDVEAQKKNNHVMESYLNSLREAVVSAFKSLAIAGSNQSLTIDNAEDCVNKLHNIVRKAAAEDANLVSEITIAAKQIDTDGLLPILDN